MGPSSVRNPGFPWGLPAFKIPVKPRALAMTTQGVVKRWGNLELGRPFGEPRFFVVVPLRLLS
jgi:hypothetical protein